MSYTPTNWKSGDVVTSTKLNKLEQGVANAGGGGSALVVTLNVAEGTLDKTWEEIYEAFGTTGAVIATPQGAPAPAGLAAISEIGFAPKSSTYHLTSNGDEYVTATADGYPQVSSE